MSAPKEIQDLVQRFEENKASYLNPSYNETMLRRDFLDPFFRALGWDIDNAEGFAEAYRDVVHEDALRVGKTTKAPDYAFRVGGLRKFFVEAKKPSVNIKSDPSSALQLRRYAWSANLPLSILTDFEELAIYDCRIKPLPTDNAAVGRIFYIRYDEFIEKWELIESIFSKKAIYKGSFDRYVDDKKNKKGTATVDNDFLNTIESWRELLAVHIAKTNKTLNVADLNYVVQATIDRIVFLRICEDRGIEATNQLKEIAEKKDIYNQLIEIFKTADDKFNSGLFHFGSSGSSAACDKLSLTITIEDKILKEIIKQLYYPVSPYEFSALPAEILGHVYERFLGKVIVLSKGRKAIIEKKPELKKQKGVYYTPSFIVDYIVKNTIGKYLEGKTPKQIQKLSIVDPTCGSGSFLLGAYQFLIDWYLEYYLKNKAKYIKSTKTEPPKLVAVGKDIYRLTIQEKKRILISHVFGVDIDPQAVEVTKLSLLLKVLEGESSETINQGRRLFHERALPDLDQNIQSGNSLVENDLFDGSLDLDQDLRLRVNPFDWKAGFPQIFAKGGFDVVIGNPPYVYRNSTQDELKAYYKERFKSLEGNFELYKFFLEKSKAICKADGRIGMIVSATFLVQPTAKKLREILLTQTTIMQLAPLGPKVFQDATVDTTIIIYRPGAPPKGHKIEIITPIQPNKISITPPYSTEQVRFDDSKDRIIDYRLTDIGFKIFSKISKKFPSLESMYELGVGINTGYIKSLLTAATMVDKRFHPMTPGNGISRYGHVQTKGWIMYDKDFVQKQGDKGRTLPPERFFSSDKILIVRTRNLSLSRRIISTIDTKACYNLNRLSNIIAKDKNSLYGLLGILNSDFINWVFSSRYYDYEIKPVYLSSCPIADPNDPELIKHVKALLKLVDDFAKATTPSSQVSIQRGIAAKEILINERVYALYGLNPLQATYIRDNLRNWASTAIEIEAESDSDEENSVDED